MGVMHDFDHVPFRRVSAAGKSARTRPGMLRNKEFKNPWNKHGNIPL